jgi:hypothetical protein
MQEEHHYSAANITATVFGILAGLGGLTHGVGEVLQGNVQPDGLFIDSWKQGPIASNMGGEPGLTIVPNLLVTGILTIVTALALILWSVGGRRKVQGKRYGLVLLALSVVLLLVGGGVGPPVIGILAGIAGMGPSATDRRRLSEEFRRTLAAGWPWVFGVTAANGVFLVIGSVILVYLFDVNRPDLFTNSFFFSVVSLIATLIVGRAHDRTRAPQRDPAF